MEVKVQTNKLILQIKKLNDNGKVAISLNRKDKQSNLYYHKNEVYVLNETELKDSFKKVILLNYHLSILGDFDYGDYLLVLCEEKNGEFYITNKSKIKKINRYIEFKKKAISQLKELQKFISNPKYLDNINYITNFVDNKFHKL